MADDPKLVEAAVAAVARSEGWGATDIVPLDLQAKYRTHVDAVTAAINASGTHWVASVQETMDAIKPEIDVWDHEIPEPILRTMVEAIAYVLCAQAGMDQGKAKERVAAMRTAYLAKTETKP